MVRPAADDADVSLFLPILDFPIPLTSADRALQEALEILRIAEGHIHPLLDLTLCAQSSGQTITAAAAPGTTMNGAAVVDTSDISATQVRLIVTGTGTGTAEVYDATNATVLASVALNGTTAVGAWTSLVQKSNDRTLALRIVGNGVNSQTIYSAHAQLRTTRFQQ